MANLNSSKENPVPHNSLVASNPDETLNSVRCVVLYLGYSLVLSTELMDVDERHGLYQICDLLGDALLYERQRVESMQWGPTDLVAYMTEFVGMAPGQQQKALKEMQARL